MKFPSANGTWFQQTRFLLPLNRCAFPSVSSSGGPVPPEEEPYIPLATKILLTEFQFARDCDVAVIVCPVQIIQQTPALTDHLKQPAPGAVVFNVLLQMLSEMIDPLRQQSNLNVGTAGIAVMHPKRFNCFVFLFHTVRFQNQRIR